MRIKTVSIKNFRSILQADIDLDSLTALVGRNGAGKSTVLKAIELFYLMNPRLEAEDFYNRDNTASIEVLITFADLDADDQQQFKAYIQNNELSVVRVLTLNENKYHGSSLLNREFRPLREMKTAAEIRAEYTRLRENGYDALPAYTNQKAAVASLKAWEEANPGSCAREKDDGQFFGFKQVGQGYLGKSTKFLLIPAVRDASLDAQEGRGSAITELMDLVVRRTLFEKQEVKAFRQEMEDKYNELFDPAKLVELNELSDNLTKSIRTYVTNASVNVLWETAGEIAIPQPRASVQLVEDGFASEVSRTGHGLQRAFVLTMLQHLSAPTQEGIGNEARNTKQPDLVLGIEEPELYQHPSRQRHFRNVLAKLAANQIPGVARKVQIIHATHCPLMISLDGFDQIRLVRKVEEQHEKPKVSKIIRRTLDEVANKLASTYGDGRALAGATLKPRLVTLMGLWFSEGFFADVVVLVEGEGDRAAILATANVLDKDFDGNGISIIPCLGKANLINAAAVFMAFGLPTYMVWDSDSHLGQTAGKCTECGHNLDSKADPVENHRLLRLAELAIADWPEHVDGKSGCFRKKLEVTMREEIGEDLFNRLVDECKQQFEMTRNKDAIKNPALLTEVLVRAKKEQGKRSQTLEAIVAAIMEMRSNVG